MMELVKWCDLLSLWVIVCHFIDLSQTNIIQTHNPETCSYHFQVWQPEQDVLNRLHGIETLCSNVTSSVDYQLLSLRNHVITEVLNAQNVTTRLEKDMLQQKLKHVQQQIDLKDLKLDFVELQTETRKIWDAVNIIDNSVGSIPRGLTSSTGGVMSSGRYVTLGIHEAQKLERDFQRTRDLAVQLKNNVGDLKAEWLLIKREVNDIKTQNLQGQFNQDDLKVDTVKLKSLIDTLKAQTGLIRNQLNSLEESHVSLQKNVDAFKSISENGIHQVEVSRLHNEVIDLRSRCDHLDGEVVRLQTLNDDIRNEALNVLGGHNSINVSDITRLLQKMATVRVEDDRNVVREIPPRDCHDVHRDGYRVSGVYKIQTIGNNQSEDVYCEMSHTDGWTVISRREDGSLSFSKGWLEYRNGFGSLYGEFWLGNENIYKLTKQRRYKLRVDLWDWEGRRAYAEYGHFVISSEDNKYRLKVRDYRGDAGDSLGYHDNMAFSTEDSDNDHHMRNCADENKGGWWYDSCYASNLNGQYHTGWYAKTSHTSFADGVVWFSFKVSEFYSLRKAEMKIRPA